jgi:hypothetical protein
MRAMAVEEARQFVREAILPATSEAALESVESVDEVLATGKNQAAVVGSDVVSFVSGVTAEQRQDIVKSALLAQLVAKVQVPDGTRIYDWYEAYFKVFRQIGWVVQDQGFAVYRESSEGFEAHEAIIGLATTLLAPNPAALAVVKATLDSLKQIDANSPWLTIFNRESQTAKTARFQITLVEPAANKNQFLVTLMAFGLEAKSILTQVLFFKFRANQAVLKHFSGRVTVDAEILAGVREDIKQKIAKHVKAYVRALPDLDVKLPAPPPPPVPVYVLETLSPLASQVLDGVSDDIVSEAAGFREDVAAITPADGMAELESTVLPADWRATISATGYQFIVRWETGGQAYYEKVIRGRPIWPGYSSGITIGCGFDLGYHSLSEFQSQWGPRMGQADFTRLVPTIGFRTVEPNRAAKVAQAKALVQSLSDIVISWAVAIEQFDNVKYPLLVRTLYRALDNLDRIHPHCRAALLSLTFNRGAAFASADPRFAEMRQIGLAMRSGQPDDLAPIPDLLRAMKRIWGAGSSLAKRREGEAQLFEAGLREMALAGRSAAHATRPLESVLEATSPLTESMADSDLAQTDDADPAEVEAILEAAEGLEAAALSPASVGWNPKDDEQPDYRHLDTSLAGSTFDLTPDLLDVLIGANEFSPKPGKLIVALRGASLGGVAKRQNVDLVPVTDQRPDHRTFRCVIGVYDRTARTLCAYQASTVPNAAYVYKCYAMAQAGTPVSQLIGNTLPTGCYTYTVGTHRAGTRGEIPTVPRLSQSATGASSVVVLRSLDDTIYDRFDRFVIATPADNIHPGQMSKGFSSAGCLTIPGFYSNGRHSGVWSDFRQALGVGPVSNGAQFSLVLVTGLDAAVGAQVLAHKRTPANIARLRHGSAGNRVGALQKSLGLVPDASPLFGPTTRQALVARQIDKLGWSDAIYSPAMDQLLGFGLYPSS